MNLFTLPFSPGINRISLRLQSRPTDTNVPTASTHSHSAPSPEAPAISTATTILSGHPIQARSEHSEIFDPHGLPLPQYYRPLLDTFFKTLAPHFPSISRKRMEERLETGTMSAFLLNCESLRHSCLMYLLQLHFLHPGICAISARYAHLYAPSMGM